MSNWIKLDREPDGKLAFECSECCALVASPCNYCPRCGAKMDGEIEYESNMIRVIRCRDCKYYSEREQFGVVMTECRYSACDVWTEPNGYCHRAKRRRKEGEQ